MIYKNPRLKHVEKIVDICDKAEGEGISSKTAGIIKHQCNLLLERKKKKKWCKCPTFMEIDGICNRCMLPKKDYFQPSPQPEIDRLDLVNASWAMQLMPGYKEIMIEAKINELVNQLNKLTKTK